MPIYEYQCNKCGKEFEYLVLGSDKPQSCPHCKSSQFGRVLSSCGFVSKGKVGETVSSSASSCGGCAGTSCATCGH